MGVKGLSTFLRDPERFHSWLPVNFQEWTHLIIDGNNICHTLYKKHYSWLLGGEYGKFRLTLEEFFKDASFNHPIVVFDGADFDEEKLSKWDRRIDAMRDMQAVQVKRWWDVTKVREGAKATPLLLISVLKDVLRSLNIEICVVEGEADNMIAALANHHKCPVLSSDSDYFIFELEYGFIHFDRYYAEKNAHSLFNVQKFMEAFNLKDYELRLLIPCFFGNDFIKSSKRSTPNEYSTFLAEIAGRETYLQDFLDRPGKVKKFEKAKRSYCIPSVERASNLPRWVLESFTAGCFPSYLVSALHTTKFFLPRVVEVMEKSSAWETSAYIREFLYGFMGLPADKKVREVSREDYFPRVIEKPTSPKLLSKNPITIFDPIFTYKDEEILKDLVLAVLKCHNIPGDDMHIFNHLEDRWKLPIAATFYWYRHKSTPRVKWRRDLLKSLLLSFLTCSDVIQVTPPSLPPVTPSTRPDHLTALHAFAQWQCVYFDARALNYLAREPFPTTSPAFLYSGEVAMHYASFARKNLCVDSAVAAGSKEWVLYNKFLYLVTGSGGGGKVGSHAKHQPRPKAPVQVEKAPLLKETNRYALLPDSP